MLSFSPFPKMEYTTGKDKQSYYSIFLNSFIAVKADIHVPTPVDICYNTLPKVVILI